MWADSPAKNCFLFNFFCLLCVFFLGSTGWCLNSQHLAIRVVHPRGGMGDVAAAYLIASDFRARQGFSGKITLIADTESRSIISILGQRELENLNIQVVSTLDLEDLPPADLVIEPAKIKGVLAANVASADSGGNRLKLSRGAVRVAIPVFGNTEANGELGKTNLGQISVVTQSEGLLREQIYEFPGPGPGIGETGIYPDPEALRLRSLSREEIIKEVSGDLAAFPDLHDLFLSRSPSESIKFFAYGISHNFVGKQVVELLESLLEISRTKNKSIVIVSPQTCPPAVAKDPKIAPYLTTIDKTDSLPTVDQPGKITWIKMNRISHSLFLKLTLLSDLPYIIAGDGALSGAISLAKPFQMTRTPWSVKVFRAWLASLRQTPLGKSIDQLEVYEKTKSFSLGFNILDNDLLFQQLAARVPLLSDSIAASATWLQQSSFLPLPSSLPPVFVLKRLWKDASPDEISEILSTLPKTEKIKYIEILEENAGRFGISRLQAEYFLRLLRHQDTSWFINLRTRCARALDLCGR